VIPYGRGRSFAQRQSSDELYAHFNLFTAAAVVMVVKFSLCYLM